LTKDTSIDLTEALDHSDPSLVHGEGAEFAKLWKEFAIKYPGLFPYQQMQTLIAFFSVAAVAT